MMHFPTCQKCGKIHEFLKFAIGDRVRIRSMDPHQIMVADADYTGKIGVVVKAERWETIRTTVYGVNFNKDPQGAWWWAAFDFCQLEPE